MEMGPDQGCFPETVKSIFISDIPGQEEVGRQEFAVEGNELNLVSGSRYLGAYMGPQEELAVWVEPQVEAWSHGVRVICKIFQQHLQSDYSGLEMLLKLEW